MCVLYCGQIFGSSKMGATIVDALDTLLLMGLNKEVMLRSC